jgi:hypothetical protein
MSGEAKEEEWKLISSAYWIWAHWISFGKYSFEAALTAEFRGEEFPCIMHNDTNITNSGDSVNATCDCFYPDLNRDCILQGEELVENYELTDVNPWAWIGVELGIVAALRILFYLGLRFFVTGKR